MAVKYETRGNCDFRPWIIVDTVSTVVIPNATRADLRVLRKILLVEFAIGYSEYLNFIYGQNTK